MKAILDCYTDEPAGLGVPPYIGTYPRYIAGMLRTQGHEYEYITIDDLRNFYKPAKESQKTDIRRLNLTLGNVPRALDSSGELYVIIGAHVPGKYLSAVPGTLREVSSLLRGVKCRKILCGPAVHGTGAMGGRRAEVLPEGLFDCMLPDFSYSEISGYALAGAEIARRMPFCTIAELETARGCARGRGCSFCTEPLKSRHEFRDVRDIVAEAKALWECGVRHFRLGRQSDFFSWGAKDIRAMLSAIRSLGARTLHIDNIDPASVNDEKAEITARLCTPGNIAALGIESFDPAVVRENNLNSAPELSLEAVRTINRHGSMYGENGMPLFLPGINILFGLKGESKRTHAANMGAFENILGEGLLVRRINVRQVSILPGTEMARTGERFIRKNRRHYWKWRNEIRQRFDNPMLKRLVPKGHVLKDVRMEIYDGNTTFGRQIGTYPLIVGVRQRLGLGEFYDVKVTGHMLRSVVAEPLSHAENQAKAL